MESQIARRGRGQVSAAAVASGLVVIVTSTGWLLAYDFAESPLPGWHAIHRPSRPDGSTSDC